MLYIDIFFHLYEFSSAYIGYYYQKTSCDMKYIDKVYHLCEF